MMEDAGQKLKRVRERLGLKYRDVEEASQRIAAHHQNDEFTIALSRLSDIENKGTIPSFFRLYSLCAIYRIEVLEVIAWYGVPVKSLPSDIARIELERTNLVSVDISDGVMQLPVLLDPGFDPSKTTHLTRAIQRWGVMPIMLFNHLDLKSLRYGYIGTDDFTMYPILQPGALVVLDEGKKRIATNTWLHESDRPIYFLELRDRYICAWCSLKDGTLIVQPHPSSGCDPEVFAYPDEIEVIGQVIGLATLLDPARRRR
ncbi:MAG: helix-turn-helix transcriptional regulator [Bryobacteraceae bacterium]